jgi:hypothetical protein
MGLDPQKGFAEMYEDGGVKIPLGLRYSMP